MKRIVITPMQVRLPKSVVLRRILYLVFLFAATFLVTEASFRLQSYFFARKVQSLLSRMETLQLDKTTQAELVTLIPELKPGSRYLWSNESDARCPCDACYALHIQN